MGIEKYFDLVNPNTKKRIRVKAVSLNWAKERASRLDSNVGGYKSSAYVPYKAKK